MNNNISEMLTSAMEKMQKMVDVNTIKFAEKPEDFGEIINKVDAELFGLF